MACSNRIYILYREPMRFTHKKKFFKNTNRNQTFTFSFNEPIEQKFNFPLTNNIFRRPSGKIFWKIAEEKLP